MAFPRPDAATKAFSEALIPDDPRVTSRPMFGNFAGFVNGNMFIGIFGSQVFVRLPDADRAELLQVEGTSIMEVMPGRTMNEYVVFPDGWRGELGKAQEWVAKSLAWASALPEKKGKKR